MWIKTKKKEKSIHPFSCMCEFWCRIRRKQSICNFHSLGRSKKDLKTLRSLFWFCRILICILHSQVFGTKIWGLHEQSTHAFWSGDIPSHNLIKLQMGWTLIIQTLFFLFVWWSVTMVLPGSIVWKVRMWLPSFSYSSALAIKHSRMVWLQSVFWEAVPPVTPGSRAGLWVWAVGRGIPHNGFCYTACDPDLICYFLALIPCPERFTLAHF